jgi:hypothetical protein
MKLGQVAQSFLPVQEQKQGQGNGAAQKPNEPNPIQEFALPSFR